MHRLRPVMEVAWEALEQGEIPIAIAPTSYGKTMASPEIYRRARETGLASGLIHVAPLRSLVAEIYKEHFSSITDSGYQSGAEIPTGRKSPYFLRSLVVSTLESYFWNIFKIPVVEYMKIAGGKSEGHFYPVLASIASYINVLDEVHLPLEWGSGAVSASMTALISFLGYYKVPFVIESATLPTGLIRGISFNLRALGVKPRVIALKGNDDWSRKLRALPESIAKVELVNDCEFLDTYMIPWSTVKVNGLLEAVRNACSDASRGLKVLVTVNTVPRAIKAYRYLSSNGCKAVLLHGRLSERDKHDAAEEITKMNSGVIIATQTIEAGVDVNAHVLYTDPAPAESLAQRAGRLCRRDKVLKECRNEGARVALIAGEAEKSSGPYNKNLISRIEETLVYNIRRSRIIDWRLPVRPISGITYAELLEEYSEYSKGLPGRVLLLSKILKEMLVGEPQPSKVVSLLDRLDMCSFSGSSIRLPVLVGDDPKYDHIDLDLAFIANTWTELRSILEFKGDSLLLITGKGDECKAKMLTELLKKAAGQRRIPCRTANSKIIQDLRNCGLSGYTGGVYLKARDKAYLTRQGLIADVEAAKRA